MLAVLNVSGINPAQIGLVLTYSSEFMFLFLLVRRLLVARSNALSDGGVDDETVGGRRSAFIAL